MSGRTVMNLMYTSIEKTHVATYTRVTNMRKMGLNFTRPLRGASLRPVIVFFGP
jgi:hypothetical protein